jgi:ClpP class serine protease
MERGLVDELGGLHTAVRRAKEAVGLAPTDDVFLIPFPKQRSLSEQLIEALQLTAARVGGAGLDWRAGLPDPLRELAAWAGELPSGTPLLIPPAIVDIR